MTDNTGFDLPIRPTHNRRAIGQRLALALPWLWMIGWAALLVGISENLLFVDRGDFARLMARVLVFPDTFVAPAGQTVWQFLDGGFRPVENRDFATLYFRACARLMALLSPTFDLAVVSLQLKTGLVLGLGYVAHACVPFPGSKWPRALVFTVLCLVAFQAHNIGMLKSFYAEGFFFVALVWLTAAMLQRPSRTAMLILIAASAVAGLAKVQYFFMPSLVLVCMAAAGWSRSESPGRWFVAAMLAVQTLCLLPLLHNPYAQLNYHQSTFFGSYLVQSPEQLRALGLTTRQIECVGSDAWGHKAAGPGGSQPVEGTNCYKEQVIGLRDVLAPYVRDPGTAWRLARYALPQHFTVQYFHVFRSLPYLATTDGRVDGPSRWLVRLTRLREATVTRVWPVLLGLGLLVPAISLARRRSTKWAGLDAAMLLLSLFICSQIAVALLGEGIRDLSKHLWAAQLALDLLTLALAGWLGLYFSTRFGAGCKATVEPGMVRRSAG